jgi:cobalt/nickel transport system permease protein
LLSKNKEVVMHIPDGMLQGAVCPVTAILSVTGVGLAAWRAFIAKNKPAASRFAAVTALIFAAQMLNFPISSGTSGHLLGGVLAAVLLGIPFGILSISVVVTIQSLVFSDGGTSVLGANIFNMAIVGAGLGGIIYAYLRGSLASRTGRFLSLGLSAWLSILMAALACSIQLAIAGTIPFLRVMPAMLGAHAFIGIGEAFITLALCLALAREPLENVEKKSAVVPFLAAMLIAVVLSPFASGLPDGLEWVAEKFNFLHESAPSFIGIIPDYNIAAINNEFMAVSLAGLAGVVVTFAFAWAVARLFSRDSSALKGSI